MTAAYDLDYATCRSPVCDRPVWNRGWCAAHYVRWQTTGDARPLEPIHVSLADRALDLLDVDGGWLTTAALADRLGGKYESVLRSLMRMRAKGLVRSRPVALRGQRNVMHEWKAT